MAKKAHVDVTLNGEEAKARLKEIGEELKKLKVLKDKFLQEGNASGVDSVNKEMKKLNGESAKLSKNVTDVNNVLKNLSSASIQELNAALRVGSRELNAMKRTDPGFADQQKKVIALRNELDNATGKAKQHQTSMAKLADGFNKYFGMATALVASVTGMMLGFRKAAEEADNFEKRLDVLSSLTGLEGKELEYLGEEAKKMSVAVIEGNIRITESADKIVDAYTKMGSARPELLKNKEELSAVTQEALILAAAADGEVQPAVEALAGVLNQFNYGADQARRVINSLAAGSKEGAGEIPYLTQAIEKAGTMAKDSNIEIEELVAAIETMAPRMTEPEIAGRNLRNMLLTLRIGADDTNPALVGLGGALDALAKKQLTAKELEQQFGRENITGAQILINNREEFKKYAEAVTGSNVALEQAAINTDNDSTKKDQALNKLKLITMELGEKLSPALLMSTNGFTYLLKGLVALPGFVSRYQVALIALTGAVLAHNASLIKSNALKAIDFIWNKNLVAQWIRNTIVLNTMVAAERLKAIWTAQGTIASKAATTAQWLWNAAVAANPIGLIITAITALIGAIKLYDKYNAESIRLEKLKQQRIEELKKATDTLNLGNEVRQEALKNLNTLSKDQIQLLAEQTSSTLKQAEADLTGAKAKQLLTQQENTRVTLWQRMMNYLGSGGNMAVYATQNSIDAATNGIEASKEMQDGIDALSESIKKLKEQKNELNLTLTAEADADKIQNRTLAQMEEKLRLYQTALKAATIGSSEYIRVQKKISDTNKLIAKEQDNFNNSTAGDVDKQIGAYAELTDSIAKLEKQIKDLAAANKPIPRSLIDDLASKKADLERVDATIKSIAQGISIMASKKAGLIPTLDIGEKRTGNSEVNIGGITQEEEDERKQAALSIADSTQNAIFNIVRNKQQAEFDHKMSLLEKQRDAELANENLTEAQRDKIREKYRKKETALKLEQWKKQKAADLVQAMIKGALAVITAMSQMGPLGAVVAGAAVAAEIATIAATKPPEFKGGGFTDNSASDDEPAGTVHANEFVANAYATRNPSVRKVLNIIDIAQKTGSIRTMNLPAMIASTEYERKLKAGGYVTRSTIKEPVPNELYNSSEIIDAIDRFGIYVDKMQTIKIEAEGKWIYQDFKEMKEKEDRLIAKTA
jgi:TP901 family phage tail tape measure protein